MFCFYGKNVFKNFTFFYRILKHLLQNEFVTKNFKKRIEKIIIQQKHRVEKKQWWKQCSNQYKCNRFVKKKIKQQQNKQI